MATSDADHDDPGPAVVVGQLAAPGRPDEQPHDDRHQTEYGASDDGVERHVEHRTAHLGDLALRLAGDVAVALHQLLGACRRWSCPG